LKPRSEAELAELIASAPSPFSIRGGGTRLLASGDAPGLETSALKGISLYEPGALTLVAQAGTPLADIEKTLDGENQRLAFEPPDLRGVLGTKGNSTIGGIAASNASGPRRISVGACRDFMLGVRFVDGRGDAIKNGGRVMKNVTGYDLVKLMSGAHGTLGVLSEVSMKVLPKPEMQLCLRIPTQTPESAVKAMSAALGSPFEVSGAACDLDGSVLLRVEGFEASVRYRAAQLCEKLKNFGEIETLDDQTQCTAIWQGIRDLQGFVGTSGDLWRISVKPSDAPHVLTALRPSNALLDWGGGLIWAEMPIGTNARDKLNVAGHATLVRASAETFTKISRFHPEAAPLAKISKGLRAQFDPKGLFNPGLMEHMS